MQACYSYSKVNEFQKFSELKSYLQQSTRSHDLSHFILVYHFTLLRSDGRLGQVGEHADKGSDVQGI